MDSKKIYDINYTDTNLIGGNVYISNTFTYDPKVNNAILDYSNIEEFNEKWDELEKNSRDYDPTSKVIEDISVDALEWFDTKGKKKLFPRSALDTLLSRMRKNPI